MMAVSSIRVAIVRVARLLAAVFLCLSATAAVAVSKPLLSSNTEVATAGFYQLSWTGENGAVELQESTDRVFTDSRILYSGPDRATVVSGRPDGVWHYRARSAGDPHAPWSDTVSVIVSHHGLQRALWFFLIGLVVFIATGLLVMCAKDGSRGHD